MRDIRIIHNTIVNRMFGIYWGGSDRKFVDVVFDNNIMYSMHTWKWELPGMNITSNNLYTGPAGEVLPEHLPQAIHGESPGFVSLDPVDFHLSPDSPAVDAGAAHEDYHHVARGKAPDLGAFFVTGYILFSGNDLNDFRGHGKKRGVCGKEVYKHAG